MISNVKDPVQLFQYKNTQMKVICLDQEKEEESDDSEKEKVDDKKEVPKPELERKINQLASPLPTLFVKLKTKIISTQN